MLIEKELMFDKIIKVNTLVYNLLYRFFSDLFLIIFHFSFFVHVCLLLKQNLVVLESIKNDHNINGTFKNIFITIIL